MIKNKFLETIREYNLLEKGERVVVAVSGGADSTALLNLLDACKTELKISLHVAHLNHLIRKKDAELDVRCVQGLAQRLGLPISVEAIDVQAYAKQNKMGIEAAAREVRYAFLEKTANKIGGAKIAVGHSADDNVETFLMRLLRGSGLKGLCGIPARRGRIIRPLIKIWRREIEDYVGSLKLVPRRDYTNYESKYMRNRVRLKLLPQLKMYNLNVKEIILQTILLLTGDRQYLEIKSEEALAKVLLSKDKEEFVLDIGKIKSLEDALQGHLIRVAIGKVKGDLSDLTYTHVHSILENLAGSEKWELHLPGGVFVVGNRGKLIINREKPQPPIKRFYRYQVAIPGEVEIRELGKKLRVSLLKDYSLGDVNKVDSQTAFVDYAMLGKSVVVRNKQDGDRFIPLGMRGSKKIQDLFVDEKIPAELRDTIPIVESKGKVIWAAGVRLDDRAKVTKATKQAVRLDLL